MKILFTGGGSGGHFYPLVAVAESVNRMARERKLVALSMYYAGPDPYDERRLFENGIEFRKIPAGKLRRGYGRAANILDAFSTIFGILKAVLEIYLIFPDAIFTSGGFGSFPTAVAARLFKIPVVLLVPDAVPGRVHRFVGKFAKRIAMGFRETSRFFAGKQAAFTGVPVRSELLSPEKEGGAEFLKLEPETPVILILGGSQGARALNDRVFDALSALVTKYQILHQVGEKNLEEARRVAEVILKDNPNAWRYRIFGILGDLALKMAAGAADLVISRAGASAISEIAIWGLPSIIVPISENLSHDQKVNAYSYARSGAALVIEEKNLTVSVLISEIERLMENKSEMKEMSESAKKFARPDAADKIAGELLAIALEHEE